MEKTFRLLAEAERAEILAEVAAEADADEPNWDEPVEVESDWDAPMPWWVEV